MRNPFVVGNWKMNGLLASARSLVAGIVEGLGAVHERVRVGIAPPAVLLMPMCKALAGTPLRLGAQNAHYESSGAFTGEISPAMLLDAGCRFVIIGHSERRRLFGEQHALLRKKVDAAVAAGLDVIYCIGELLEQRQAGETMDVLKVQLDEGLAADLDWNKTTVAYEPVWAIGTGQNASADQAQQAHAFIREWLGDRYGADAARQMCIQYGGSVNPSNARQLLGMPDVDGALVGGASLKPQEFLGIVHAASALATSGE